MNYKPENKTCKNTRGRFLSPPANRLSKNCN